MSIRFDHINLTVSDLEASVQWYGKIFGFRKVEEGPGKGGHKWAIVACEDSMLVMTEVAGKKPAHQEDQAEHRIYHFGLRVPDAEQWRAQVKEHSLQLYYGGEITYPRSRSWYIHDPSGHEIEVSCTDGTPLF